MNGHHQGTSTGLKSADIGLGRCDHLIDFALTVKSELGQKATIGRG
jgi:hypothetical protein